MGLWKRTIEDRIDRLEREAHWERIAKREKEAKIILHMDPPSPSCTIAGGVIMPPYEQAYCPSLDKYLWIERKS